MTSQAGVEAKRRINVVGAALVRNGRVLAAQRGPAGSLPGLWEFPGGKIEAGESHEEALARELQEELQCEAQVGAHLDTTEHEYDFGIVVLSIYFCNLIEGDPVLTEHSSIRWLLPSELLSIDWAPADVPAVAKLVQLGEL